MGGIWIGWHCVGVLSPVSIKIFQSMYDEWEAQGWARVESSTIWQTSAKWQNYS